MHQHVQFRLLLDVCRSDQELSLLFPKGMKVKFDAVNQPTRLVPDETTSGGGSGGGAGSAARSSKKFGWAITLLWVGKKPDLEDFKLSQENESLQQQEKMFLKRMELVEKKVNFVS